MKKKKKRRQRVLLAALRYLICPLGGSVNEVTDTPSPMREIDEDLTISAIRQIFQFIILERRRYLSSER